MRREAKEQRKGEHAGRLHPLEVNLWLFPTEADKQLGARFRQEEREVFHLVL